MKFYDVKQFNNLIGESGIDAMKMAKAFEIISKSSYKTMDDLAPYNFVFLTDSAFVQNENNPIDFIYTHPSNKRKSRDAGDFALIKKGQIFNIEYNREIYFCKIHNNKLHIEVSLKKIEELTLPNLNLTPLETKVIDWLETGRVGNSSLTICKTLFPNLEHSELNTNEKYNAHPYDNSDVERCQNFLNLDPEIKARFQELKSVSPAWSKLVDNWNDIENYMNKEESQKAYDLIKESIETKKLKP